MRYTGKAVHAGFAPHEGINALNAAVIGLNAVNAQRETFRDEDHVRVHPIITKGGDLVNVVPEDVRIESYVRAANMQAILDASAKVNRAFKAGGDAVGAKTDILDIPGYLPYNPCEPLMGLMLDNLRQLVGERYAQLYCEGFGGASTDAGDVSYIMPVLHAFFGGAQGALHSKEFCINDKELAIITATKALVMLLIDLLADGALEGLRIKNEFQPAMTKEEYLKVWGQL